jgi:hypothetical protein
MSSKLRQLPAALVELQKPGACEERLALPKVRDMLKSCVHEACETLEQMGQGKIAAWLRDHLTEGAMPAAGVQHACLSALQTGSPQSICTPLGDRYFYVIAFPGRYEHHQLMRRYGFLSQGWLRHAAETRRTIDASGRAEMFCLLLFLQPDARDVIGVYAWEGAGQRIECARVLDERERQQPDVQVFEQAYHVML